MVNNNPLDSQEQVEFEMGREGRPFPVPKRGTDDSEEERKVGIRFSVILLVASAILGTTVPIILANLWI